MKISDSVTLELIARQQQRILDELAGMRAQFALMQDDIRVLTSMAIRQDTATRNTLDLLHRTIDRVRQLEDAPTRT